MGQGCMPVPLLSAFGGFCLAAALAPDQQGPGALDFHVNAPGVKRGNQQAYGSVRQR